MRFYALRDKRFVGHVYLYGDGLCFFRLQGMNYVGNACMVTRLLSFLFIVKASIALSSFKIFISKVG